MGYFFKINIRILLVELGLQINTAKIKDDIYVFLILFLGHREYISIDRAGPRSWGMIVLSEERTERSRTNA